MYTTSITHIRKLQKSMCVSVLKYKIRIEFFHYVNSNSFFFLLHFNPFIFAVLKKDVYAGANHGMNSVHHYRGKKALPI